MRSRTVFKSTMVTLVMAFCCALASVSAYAKTAHDRKWAEKRAKKAGWEYVEYRSQTKDRYNFRLGVIEHNMQNVPIPTYYGEAYVEKKTGDVYSNVLSDGYKLVYSTRKKSSNKTVKNVTNKMKKFGFKSPKYVKKSGSKYYYTVKGFDDKAYIYVDTKKNAYYFSKNGKKYANLYPAWRTFGEFGIRYPQDYEVKPVSDNKIKYRTVDWPNGTVHAAVFGKWHTVSLTSKTVYLKGNMTQYNKVYSYFKNSLAGMAKTPYLKKSNKTEFMKYLNGKYHVYDFGINVKNGKVVAISFDSQIYG